MSARARLHDAAEDATDHLAPVALTRPVNGAAALQASADLPVTPLRRRMMRSVRRTDTKPEMIVRRALFARGYRYRLHVRGLPGTPDIVFSRRKFAVFVHGCFWHRHVGCRLATTPKARADFWNAKFLANQRRDAANRAKLEDLGWQVLELWECEIRSGAYLAPLLCRVAAMRSST